MSFVHSRCALGLLAVLLAGGAARAEPMVPGDYALVWADEFEQDGPPDPGKWAYDIEHNKRGWFNNEQQYYSNARAENARVEKGALIIEARADAAAIAKLPDWGGQRYSSARLRTLGKASWTYGAVEVRAKLPCGRGTWSAIWMLPDDKAIPWPDSGEIDIMEHVGFDPGKVHFSTHTKNGNFIDHTERTAAATVSGACGEMHRYQLRWTPNLIVMGVDDQRSFAFKRPSAKRSDWPFDGPFHLLLNIAIGGDWGGQQGIDPAAFPARMEIDYVRVYQQKKP
ncbi:MAG: glycoside hydrolase [Proteobacteria bacterium SG_bin6]|nr:MAG: glycoside hydrolase [Proteobacteria bacterium SG_bin6]